MLVKDCMTKDVQIISPDTTLQEAAKLMRDGDFGAVPVGDGDRLIGVITDRDIAIRAVAEDLGPDTEVRDVMSEGILYCYEDQSINEVLQNMGDVQVRRLPVLNRQKRMIGILSLGDVARTNDEEIDGTLAQISRLDHNEVNARNHAKSSTSAH